MRARATHGAIARGLYICQRTTSVCAVDAGRSSTSHHDCLECYRRLPHPRLSFVVSVVSSSYFRTFVLKTAYVQDMYTHTVTLLHVTNGPESTVPSAWGLAELRAGAAAVAIGVGSPVARLGAHGQRRREARGAAVAAVVAVDPAAWRRQRTCARGEAGARAADPCAHRLVHLGPCLVRWRHDRVDGRHQPRQLVVKVSASQSIVEPAS